MKKIKDVVITNFKFFQDSQILEINGKNVLIYGENGSGKSTVFWALYTFFESSLKTKKDVTKYFDINKDENLINLFSSDKTTSSIEVVFRDFNDPDSTDIIKKISLHSVNTNTDSVIKEASYGSDFINHRLLSRMYDFRNSQRIDLFSIFQKDILKHIRIDNINLGDLWGSIETGLALNGNRRYSMTSIPYVEYQRKVDNFNALIKRFVDDIIPETNKIIKEDFQESIKLDIKYEPAIWNAFLPGVKKSRSYQLDKPKLIVSLKYFEDILGTNSSIKPHTFMNEGRLTISFLALRLAIINRRVSTTDIKILVLDDLLLSLDMGYREEVIKIILRKYSDFQIIIMTHDRYFYNKLCASINCENKDDNWINFVFYEDMENSTIPPKPFIQKAITDDSEMAKLYLRNHDYAASANYLRKAFENLLHDLIPLNYIYNVSLSDRLTLNSLKTAYLRFCKDNSIPDQICLLSEFCLLANKTDIMNSFSHYDIKSPIYKKELIDGITIVDKMKDIKILELIQTGDEVELKIDTVGVWKLKSADKVYVMINQSDYYLLNTVYFPMSHEITHASYTGTERQKNYTSDEQSKCTKKLEHVLRMIEFYLKKNGIIISLNYASILDYLFKDGFCLKEKIS